MIKKGFKMRGSIRTFVGLILLFGVAGGLDNATDAQLLPLVVIAGLALALMYSGVTAMDNHTTGRGIE
jgi:hypothetical protein